jgi:ParB family chromosome partitioning protein
MARQRKNMLEFLHQGADSAPLRDGLKRDLPIEQLVPRQGQPRTQFSEHADDLNALASTIRQLGIIHPIIVRPLGGGGDERYEIVAGERRWRAAQLANLATVPVIERVVDDQRAALYSLAENVGRRDLNPLEQARGYHRIVNDYQITQTELAEAVGQNVKTVNRTLRLLKLEKEVQELIEQERLSAKHGELLLGLAYTQQLRLAFQAAEQEWSVRELERQLAKASAATHPAPTRLKRDPNLTHEQTLWCQRLGADVKLRYWQTGKVRITITVHSLDEYQGIRERMLLDEISAEDE